MTSVRKIETSGTLIFGADARVVECRNPHCYSLVVDGTAMLEGATLVALEDALAAVASRRERETASVITDGLWAT